MNKRRIVRGMTERRVMEVRVGFTSRKAQLERRIARERRQYVGLELWKKNDEPNEWQRPSWRYYEDRHREMERLRKEETYSCFLVK